MCERDASCGTGKGGFPYLLLALLALLYLPPLHRQGLQALGVSQCQALHVVTPQEWLYDIILYFKDVLYIYSCGIVKVQLIFFHCYYFYVWCFVPPEITAICSR